MPRRALPSSIAAVLAVIGGLLCMATPSAAEVDAVTVARIEAFVRDEFTKDWFHDPESIRRSYADPLEYWWGLTGVPLSKVLQTKREYIAQWPRSGGDLIEGTLLVVRVPERAHTLLVRFSLKFWRGRKEGPMETGTLESELLIKILGPRVIVFGEGGRLLAPPSQ